MSDSVNVVINGKNIIGKKGDSILSLAKENGIEIPTLCNDPRIQPYSSCYLCVVQVEKMNGLQPACSTKIVEGMSIYTDNEKIFKARKAALELLLSNHYADCVGPCKQTCPAGVDVQGYISLIEKGMYKDAVELIKETNPLPAICGRVCVRPCEVACRRNLMDEGSAVGIDYLKRFAADIDLSSDQPYTPKIKKNTGKKVAVIGAGPGGLSAAFFLRKEGHHVDVFESSPAAGGWLRYGIPEYRLPNNIIQKEVENITRLGVNILYNKKLGEDVKYKDIKSKYDSAILAIGSQIGTNVGCNGDDAVNVFSGVDFLRDMEVSGTKSDFSGKNVAVIGGGNTAMDCCRTAIRCNASKVYVVYRRTEKEMPANPIEIHESKLEGVEYLFLTAPVKINKDSEGFLKSMTCVKMTLGEVDSSGRRRPIPEEGSEFDLELDIVLAAIGQKTSVSFIDDVNTQTKGEELKANKWGDIIADPKTLQTGVSSIFACGDSVSGPATLIEAVAQAKIAARSCHQYLVGKKIEPAAFEFVSLKNNFKSQNSVDYKSIFEQQTRQEMPTLDPKDRKNFNEVELGYNNSEVALEEASRCLECGCSAYYSCDLKKYATEYQADQNKFSGNYRQYDVDFRHPFIEIDNNKCILCSKCVRICREVVGANALGLINRGYDTYIAPSMGNALQNTACESCGMCISACPTGAISENTTFKPGPVKLDVVQSICNYCSVGCSVNYHHKNGFVMKVDGGNGVVNHDGNICKSARFGFNYINDSNRITKPLLKVNGKFEEISFDQAKDEIKKRIRSVEADENAFYAGARLTNEEMYLIQKFARGAVRTNNIDSFHYLGRGDNYFKNLYDSMPFDQIDQVNSFLLIGSELNIDNPVFGYKIYNAKWNNHAKITVVTTNENDGMIHKADNVVIIKSYYHFIKAMNHYLLSNNLQNELFINDNCSGFYDYKKKLLAEDYQLLVRESGVSSETIVAELAVNFLNEMKSVVVFSEKELSGNATTALINFSLITGKMGKTANGVVELKEKNNSFGLFDMGISPGFGVGYQDVTDFRFRENMKLKWDVYELSKAVENDQIELLKNGMLKNVFVFGEDPIGCALNKTVLLDWFKKVDFIVVQDYFYTETAQLADLILPASLPFEIGGHYTNTQGIIQHFEATIKSKTDLTSYDQLYALLADFGVDVSCSPSNLIIEIASLLVGHSNLNDTDGKYRFISLERDNTNQIFNFGCDGLNKYFDEYVNARFNESHLN